MITFLLRRLLHTLPILVGVALLCFALLHLAPGDPLVSVLPQGASADAQTTMRKVYGFDRSLPEQFVGWVWRASKGDLGTSIASNRPVASEVMQAMGPTLRLAVVATLIGFASGCLFGFVAGTFQGSWVDKAASFTAVLGVSMPHYWLGLVLVIVFAVRLPWLPAAGAGPSHSAGWAWNWEHLRHMVLPAVAMSVIPMGIVARKVRARVAEILAQEFVLGLRAKGLTDRGVFEHVLKNAAPKALAVLGRQLGYLLGGSILIETVFAWPGTGLLLHSAILQRDLPLLQGTVLILALFFVLLKLAFDVMQALLDPRIARG